MKLSHTVFGSILLLGACSTQSVVLATDTKAVQAAIQAAVTENKKANALGYEWRDSGKVLKAAKKDLADGKLDKALKLAQKAEQFGKAAQEQAIAQKSAAPRF